MQQQYELNGANGRTCYYVKSDVEIEYIIFYFEYIARHLYTWSDVRNGIKILRKGFANVGRCDGMRQSQIRLNWLKLNHGCVLCINFLYFVITEMPWIYRISVYLRWNILFFAQWQYGADLRWYFAQIASMSVFCTITSSFLHSTRHRCNLLRSFYLNVCQMQTLNLLY